MRERGGPSGAEQQESEVAHSQSIAHGREVYERLNPQQKAVLDAMDEEDGKVVDLSDFDPGKMLRVLTEDFKLSDQDAADLIYYRSDMSLRDTNS